MTPQAYHARETLKSPIRRRTQAAERGLWTKDRTSALTRQDKRGATSFLHAAPHNQKTAAANRGASHWRTYLLIRGFVASIFFAFFNFFAIAVPPWKLSHYFFFKVTVFSSFLAFFKLFAMAALLLEVPDQHLVRHQLQESMCKWLANVGEKAGGTHPPRNLADDDVFLAKTPRDRLAKALT